MINVRAMSSEQNKNKQISKFCLRLCKGVGTRYTSSREFVLAVFNAAMELEALTNILSVNINWTPSKGVGGRFVSPVSVH